MAPPAGARAAYSRYRWRTLHEEHPIAPTKDCSAVTRRVSQSDKSHGYRLGESLETRCASSDDQRMGADTRSYKFTITFNVEPGHPAYDDPEWAADAAWGALSNEYHLRAVYTDIREVAPGEVE